MHRYTLEELMRKRDVALSGSVRAIREHGGTYRELKRLVNQINSQPLDVGDYHRTATRLGAMLFSLTRGSGGTIFHYFAEHIDPAKAGDVRCFRLECRDLADQIRQLDQWRAERQQLKRIK